jgi:serine/threonine protein kinase
VLPEVPVAIDAPDHLITSIRQATGQRYKIVRRIGSGGMADVYEARHHLLDRPLAVKVLHSHLAREQEMRERFKREAEAASRLMHPFIASPLDYGETHEAVYLVMPFIAGGCLADDLGATRIIEPPRAARIAAQVATALDYAARAGVIHRDVKPDNVLFDDRRATRSSPTSASRRRTSTAASPPAAARWGRRTTWPPSRRWAASSMAAPTSTPWA